MRHAGQECDLHPQFADHSLIEPGRIVFLDKARQTLVADRDNFHIGISKKGYVVCQ